jgi:hypothetical protein
MLLCRLRAPLLLAPVWEALLQGLTIYRWIVEASLVTIISRLTLLPTRDMRYSDLRSHRNTQLFPIRSGGRDDDSINFHTLVYSIVVNFHCNVTGLSKWKITAQALQSPYTSSASAQSTVALQGSWACYILQQKFCTSIPLTGHKQKTKTWCSPSGNRTLVSRAWRDITLDKRKSWPLDQWR